MIMLEELCGYQQSDWPIEGKDGEFYGHRLDMENSIPYESWQFSAAIANLGLVLDGVTTVEDEGSEDK